jgi:ATP-binding cassette subfamily F protein uup
MRDERARVAAPRPARPAKRLSWKEQQELAGIEVHISAAERARDDLEARLADPILYRDPAASAEVMAAFAAAKSAVESLYERWADLEERSGA